MGTDNRVLLFSTRNISRHVSRCAGYEFEDVIAACDDVDVVAPALARSERQSRIERCIASLFLRDRVHIERGSLDRDYDLLFAFCHNAMDVRYLRALRGVRERCRRSVCVIGELWPASIDSYGETLRALRSFDVIFAGINASVDVIREATGRPCRYLPFGVDSLRFCPFPGVPPRHIDVCSIGRRPHSLHETLMADADHGGILYLHDTVSDFSVVDVREHRRWLANLVKRSRFFVAYPPKFNCPEETGGFGEIGARFFEGAAGGAVMLGMPPSGDAYDACFDWPDAVIPVDADGGDVFEVIATIEADEERRESIRENGMVQSLRRHDWLYRWQEVLDAVGLAGTPRMRERLYRLEHTAVQVTRATRVG